MEFVLNTTTSTPESSRSGSTDMKFGDYREGDEIAVSISSLGQTEARIELEDSDDDFDFLEHFDAEKAKDCIISKNNCLRMNLNEDQQRFLGLKIGKNVNEQDMWKLIEKKRIEDFFLEKEQRAVENISDYLFEARADKILVGYISPFLKEKEEEMFFFCFGEIETEFIIEAIRLLEAKKRHDAKKLLQKRPRPWQSLGSEAEVDCLIEQPKSTKIEIEVQCLQSERKRKPFSFRLANDTRDGYVELLCDINEMKIKEIDRIDIAIQTTLKLISADQQTEPTFPKNAWTQYHYDVEDDSFSEYIESEADITAATGDDEEESLHEESLKTPQSQQEESIELSDAMKGLLEILEFNSIDVYRDDYALLSKKKVHTYSKPYLTECFSFIDLEMCKHRCVNAICWNPLRSKIFVVSYTFQTYKTYLPNIKSTKRYRKMKKQSMYPNPVLLWSLENDLWPLLMLEAPHEVTCLSFCPYDENLIIGGMANGQLIIWDLTVKRKGTREKSYIEDENLERLHSILDWTELTGRLHSKIKPAALTPREYSHKKAVTSIRWFHRKHYVMSTGQLKESVKPTDCLRHFVSASVDGGINFWDLDYIVPTSTNLSDMNKGTELLGMVDQSSPYNRLNGIIRPIYMLSSKCPITDLIIDDGKFSYENLPANGTEEYRVIDANQDAPLNRIIVSTLLGTIDSFIWEGYLCKEGKPEEVKQIEHFASIHNAPVLQIIRNPFISDIILSIGGSIFAIWNGNFSLDPLLWRENDSAINCCQWSTLKPSLFFLGYSNGSIELWDILVRTNQPLLTHSMGYYSITTISQHMFPGSADLLFVGDHRSAIRVLKMPNSIIETNDEDINKMNEFCENILKQKQNLQRWQDIYKKNNPKSVDLKTLQRDLSKRTIEHSLEESHGRNTQMKNANKQKLRRNYDLPERMQKKWVAGHLKRLQKNMLDLKHFDPEATTSQMKQELENLEYQREKKIKTEIEAKKYQEEVDALKKRLAPSEKIDEKIERWNTIKENAEKLFDSNEDQFKYDSVEKELIESIQQMKKENSSLE